LLFSQFRVGVDLVTYSHQYIAIIKELKKLIIYINSIVLSGLDVWATSSPISYSMSHLLVYIYYYSQPHRVYLTLTSDSISSLYGFGRGSVFRRYPPFFLSSVTSSIRILTSSSKQAFHRSTNVSSSISLLSSLINYEFYAKQF
jgi:hypothetical protein